jgi:uncharacterized protein (DUF1499 family)
MAATLSAGLGILALVTAAAGVAGASLGALRPFVGFQVFLAGALLLGLLSLVLGVIGLLRTGASSGRAGRARALTGSLIGLALLTVVVVAALPGRGLPRINDITTNPDDPPMFRRAAQELGEPLPYPGEAFAAQQRAAYPDLAPLILPIPPEEAFARARVGMERVGVEFVALDPRAGILEARAVSPLFHFVDDVAVRVRPQAGGCVVDLRSRSRDGRGDLGANARRIRAIASALRAP